MKRSALLPLVLAALFAACAGGPPPAPPSAAEEPAAEEPAAEEPAAELSPPEAARAAAPVSPALSVREGGTLVRAPDGRALYLADEDHAVLRRIPLPLDEATPPRVFPLPGRPAQVLGVGDRVLVTIRDPGLLIVLDDRAGDLSEVGRVPLPADAWGVAVAVDGARALVSSAWTHEVSLVDLSSMEVRWSVDVGREPRGITMLADGSAAWVTHLTGAHLTKIEALDAEAPTVRRVVLPADPLRTSPLDGAEDRDRASLGYAAVLSGDERRLFVARHAPGGIGWSAWSGTATVDVLATAADEPLAPHRGRPVLATVRPGFGGGLGLHDRAGGFVETDAMPFVQPRALVLRRRASTLLVASEGQDTLVELDARAVAPALAPLRVYALAGPERRVELYHEDAVHWSGKSFANHFPASACGAPSGIALSADEDTAYVYCRSTDGLAIVPLETHDAGPAPRPRRREETYEVARLAADPLPEPAASGRRLFYSATDPVTSGGLGCAACHPDGRDDGLVWREIHAPDAPPFFVGTASTLPAQEHPSAGSLGRARQTPMLAGRVDAEGPYGWLAESATLVARIRHGFALHRWSPSPSSFYDPTIQKGRAEPLAAFLREGLVPPPARGAALTEAEERGRATFSSEVAACAHCHDPAQGYTNHLALPLPRRRSAPGFDRDPTPLYKVPSLLYAGATAPYFHDGAVSTLDDLVDQNLDHMGMTSQLSAPERRDLVAFLRTLEPDRAPIPVPAGEPVPWRIERTRALPPDEYGPSRPARRWPEPALPSFTAEPWPDIPYAEPTRAEWAPAPHLRLSRSGGDCSAKRVREWLRIECNGNHLLMAGGTLTGLTITASPNTEVEVKSTITFPVRRGDRRIIQLGAGWKWLQPFAVLSEQWLEGDAEPAVAVDNIYSAGISVLP